MTLDPRITYLTTAQVAQAADISMSTLQRWVDKGELKHFVVAYRDQSGRKHFRLGTPHPWDELIPGSQVYYNFEHALEHERGVVRV